MTQKFGRNYRLTIYPIDDGEPIIISMPFTVNFSCNRNINADISEFSIDVYNLSEEHRRRIFQDFMVLGQYANSELESNGKNTKFLNILFEAGYSTLYTVFLGHIKLASSAREGTNIVTRIEATSSLLDVSGTQTQVSIAAGKDTADILNYLIAQFPNLSLGAIGNFTNKLNRPVALNGLTLELLKTYSDNKVYIDNGKVYVLLDGDVLDKTFVINDATGLLQTPRRQAGILTITTLMETGVQDIGQLVELQSTITPEFNGVYKVNGIIHQGTISGAVCGAARSIFTLQANWLFNGLNKVPYAVAAS